MALHDAGLGAPEAPLPTWEEATLTNLNETPFHFEGDA